MRFSLGTLVLVTLWIGAMIAVFIWRQPWVLVSKSEQSVGFHTQPSGSIRSPDQTRQITQVMDSTTACTLKIEDAQNKKLLAEISQRGELSTTIKFLDDDTLELTQYNLTILAARNPNEIMGWRTVFHRRFPEWWWGHFYRPEVWCALVLTVLLARRFIKRKRTQPTVK